jgi:cytochrome oxidase Cu insertion factor (SCO1/SenC/PrrC family)
MGTCALSAVAAVLLLGLAPGAAGPAHAQADPFAAMNALRVTPSSPAPDVTFQGLDGQPVRLDSFQGRPVLLTFFTTW